MILRPELWRPFGALLGLLLGLAAPVAADIEARSVEIAPSLPTSARIGGLHPLGMLELPSATVAGLRLEGLSGLAWDDDEGLLYAISDKGRLFRLHPVFSKDRLTDVEVLGAHPLRNADGRRLARGRTDAEGLDIIRGRNGRKGDAELIVSFEREPRVVSYRPDGSFLREHPLPAPLANKKAYRGGNQMLEAIAASPGFGLVTAPEFPLEREAGEQNRLFALAGRSWPYPLAPGFGIVALEPLGDGALLVLERAYLGLRTDTVIALRRVALGDTPAANETIAVLRGSEGLQLDNFEGLARHRGNRFFMVSDNNGMFFQRTLLLYFELDRE